MQHEKIKVSWNYRNFPCHPVACEWCHIIGRNNIILHYHYRVYPNLGKCVCAISRIACACRVFVAQLDKRNRVSINQPPAD